MKKILACFLCILFLSLSVVPVFAAEEKEFTVKKEAVLSALFEADIKELKTAISLGLVTSEELTEYYLARIEKYNKEYNCFITLCEDAVEVARQRDIDLAEGKGEGLLFGIPVVVKDNIDLSGCYTSNGKKLSSARIAKSNSDVVQRLLDEGAVIIGKTNLSTEALYATHSKSKAIGHTYNAYNTELSPGGSSGGTAVSVSLNFAAAGLGTDTNASLRYPAILNGCIALRPTVGLVSMNGIASVDPSRDTAGAITRSVYDQALMLDVLTNGEYSYAENLNANSLKGMKIGIISELSYPTDKDKKTDRKEEYFDPEISAAFEQAVKDLEHCGAQVVTVSFEEVFKLSEKTFSGRSQSHKERLYEAFCSFLDDNGLDAAVFPTYLSSPLAISDLDAPYINNCKIIAPSSGSPEISVPIGYHSSGAGIGMELVSKRGNEQLLLNAAYSYTSEFACRTPPVGAPDDYVLNNEGDLTEIFAARDAFLADAEKQSEKDETFTEDTPDLTVYYFIGGFLLVDLVIVLLGILMLIYYKKQ